KTNVKRGFLGRQRSGDGTARFRRLEIALRDLQCLRVLAVANFPLPVDRDVPWRDLIGGIPLHLGSDGEVLEAARPGLDGVARNGRVPVEFIGGKSAMFDVRENTGKVNALKASVRAELQAVEFQPNSSFDRSAVGISDKVGNFEALVLDAHRP